MVEHNRHGKIIGRFEPDMEAAREVTHVRS
jgi:hypothetical protein